MDRTPHTYKVILSGPKGNAAIEVKNHYQPDWSSEKTDVNALVAQAGAIQHWAAQKPRPKEVEYLPIKVEAV